MSKEVGQSFVPGKTEFGPMRLGKTERDHRTGAHDRLLQNRAAKAEENRRFHGTQNKGKK